ncbi:FeoB-associated Cys-rich membrane protein [Dethiosulfatibacter aminovorans]|uniref:FeoB-associated Cys-rich membrane protein n=1 Tax=Dethiosulfatibacter aminovorans TaxID=332095 RepID=UPI0015872E76|nr:FeoB-associated Cys-rich membrane protein [Dethiosulfatibacter aminovorans]
MINYIIGAVVIIPTIYILYSQIKRVRSGKCSVSENCNSCAYKESCSDDEDEDL